ncbi:MAG: hypothetical protein RI907_3140 [Pseudomonadota bacterium]|jgi:hypothetical protein
MPEAAPHLDPAHWQDTPLPELPARLNAALGLGMTAQQLWSVCCALLSGAGSPIVPLDSFTLHAPLELLARWQLLPLLPRADRPLALLHMAYTAVQAAQTRAALARQQPELATPWPSASEPPPGAPQAPSLQALAESLQAALDNADLTQAAQWADATVRNAAPTDTWCHQMVPVVRHRMGASAHAPIFLQLLARLHQQAPADAALARPMWVPLAVELARHPERRVSWPDTFATHTAPGTPPLLALLARQTAVAEPEAQGIWPMVAQTLKDGAHLAWLPGVDKAGAQALPIACRAAAWSMLQEPLTEARYGWTHALTLPQAWWALADQPQATEADWRAAARLATLHLAAMRRVIGQVKLALQPPPAALPFETCARVASIRADAHAVKYVLACMDAAQASPADAQLYQAAATRLCGHWADSVPEARILATLAER